MDFLKDLFGEKRRELSEEDMQSIFNKMGDAIKKGEITRTGRFSTKIGDAIKKGEAVIIDLGLKPSTHTGNGYSAYTRSSNANELERIKKLNNNEFYSNVTTRKNRTTRNKTEKSGMQTLFEDSNMLIEFKQEGVLKKQMDESVWELVVRQLYKGRIPEKQEEQEEEQNSSADSNNLRAEMKNKMIDLVIHHLVSEDFDNWSSDLYEDGVVFDDADIEIILKDDLLGKVKEVIIALIKKHLYHADSDRWNPKLDNRGILFEDDELIITIEEDEELSDKIKQAMADIIAKAWG